MSAENVKRKIYKDRQLARAKRLMMEALDFWSHPSTGMPHPDLFDDFVRFVGKKWEGKYNDSDQYIGKTMEEIFDQYRGRTR